ncbi:UDP-N-acetylglucosamine 1-carboxyvinyltransferase [Dissulfurirhabdus thermomarina]|uniref:UDP-N-acetylglucosamine 1-carboxyvinyltransferase n=1 Tax=Dissulfurirhabdus thermomarina TaxID=1765737 RepID=A0A6N9TT02_DISTH|nr:UDP-N-acetylglucosamine 1-carboxyvinyltransferase [Dissulfurirhabdus thermomarina]NDY42577.1 UDP-N-acetylglucosamine 1-carboxyvinyltransferase [Dissulfurirhabdus thermomarina]NMX22510.1 UDP-N-acetylglucosamine 1-carboxyvinyltransferase [Dissulfurirhabdus thermomarina]
MDRLVIEGGRPLKGRIRISGAKNAALPAMAAALLAGGEFRLRNVPDLRDIRTFSRLLENLGVRCRREAAPPGAGDEFEVPDLVLDATTLTGHEAPYELVKTMRASVLVLGPLLARDGKARVSLPGGCAIGARPIDFHLRGLELMGAKLQLRAGYVEARASRLNGAQIYLDTPSVTGTENLMMAAATARGTTVIKNAAREPEVVSLGEMLQAMGARIHGLGTETVVIEGVSALSPVTWTIIPDRIEAGTYIMAVGTAGGEVEIENARPDHLPAALAKLRATGLQIEVDGRCIRVRRSGRLRGVDMKTLPYPGFPTDLQAQLMAVVSLADGMSVLTETIFENRFMHVAELNRLGADIRIEGRSAIVRGVKELLGAPVMATDLRASASLVLAGLAARGRTTVSRIYHLDRGYWRMEEKLAAVGARIWREKE